MNFKKQRWICLSAAFIIEMIAGIAYIWSLFAGPIAMKYGWLQRDLSFVYTLGIIMMTITSISVGSKLNRRFTTRQIVVVGGLFFGFGSALAGYFLHNQFLFYLFQSLLRGIGSALIYPVLVAYSQQLFPEKPGFGSGVTTAGFGAGGIVWAPIASLLLTRFSVDNTLTILGGISLIIILILSFFLKKPPEEFKETMRDYVAQNPKIEKAIAFKGVKGMLKDRLFYLFFFILCFGMAGGAMIISQAGQMITFQYNQYFQSGQIGIVVSLISAGGTAGRFFFGYISDKIGRMRSLVLASILGFSATFLLMVVTSPYIFIALQVLIVLVYGGYTSMVAPLIGFFFGTKHVSENYPIMFAAFGAAGTLGPMVTSSMFDYFGQYQQAYLTAAIISFLGLIVTIEMRRIVKHRLTYINQDIL